MKRFIYILISLILASLLGYWVFNAVTKKAAGLYIESQPAANIYIDGQKQEGVSPFELTLEPGEYVVRIGEDGAGYHPFESRINLVSGVRTVIRHNFSDDYALSSSAVLSFSRDASGASGVAVVTDPPSSEVYIDDKFIGYTPLTTNAITPGEHQVSLSKSNYQILSVPIKPVSGYKLTITAKLASNPEALVVPQEDLATEDYVLVLPTETGFLRVRKEANASSEEVGRLEPGQRRLLVGTEDEWYEIEYEEGKYGYVSKDYAEVI